MKHQRRPFYALNLESDKFKYYFSKVNIVFPIIFSLVMFFLIALTFHQHPVDSGISVLILIAGVPLYCFGVLWKNKPDRLNKMMGK
jgi:hypothetical protein